MRRAFTIATVRKNGEPKLLTNSLDVTKNKDEFRKFLVSKEHPDYSEVTYFEEGQVGRTHRMAAPVVVRKPETTMKKLVSLAAFLVLSFAAQAQYTLVTLPNIPSILATTITTNLATPAIIDATKQKDVAVQFEFAQMAASTSNVVFTLQRSLDGVRWDSNVTYTVTLPSTGTGLQTFTTNWTLGGVGYMRLVSVANTTALTTATNIAVKYAVKRNAP